MAELNNTTLAKFFNGKVLAEKSFKTKGLQNYGHAVGVGHYGVDPSDKELKKMGIEFANPRIRDVAMEELAGLEGEEGFEFLGIPQPSHIGSVEYNAEHLLMRVKFNSDSSVVMYDHVPSTVFAELKMYRNMRDGEFGKHFWDVIRLRYRPNFVREGSKYAYTYVAKGESRSQGNDRSGGYALKPNVFGNDPRDRQDQAMFMQGIMEGGVTGRDNKRRGAVFTARDRKGKKIGVVRSTERAQAAEHRASGYGKGVATSRRTKTGEWKKFYKGKYARNYAPDYALKKDMTDPVAGRVVDEKGRRRNWTAKERREYEASLATAQALELPQAQAQMRKESNYGN